MSRAAAAEVELRDELVAELTPTVGLDEEAVELNADKKGD